MEAALGLKARIQTKNRAWFANKHPIESEEECMEPFPDIENITLERFYNNFMKTKGDPKYPIIRLGLWSVDIKKLIKFFTASENNT